MKWFLEIAAIWIVNGCARLLEAHGAVQEELSLPRVHLNASILISICSLVLPYGCCYRGFLHCLDARTGRQYWSLNLESEIWASPLAADGKIYLGDEDGIVHVYLAGKEMKELAANDVGEPVYTMPAIMNHTLYVMRRDKLFAIRQGAKFIPPKAPAGKATSLPTTHPTPVQ